MTPGTFHYFVTEELKHQPYQITNGKITITCWYQITLAVVDIDPDKIAVALKVATVAIIYIYCSF